MIDKADLTRCPVKIHITHLNKLRGKVGVTVIRARDVKSLHEKNAGHA